MTTESTKDPRWRQRIIAGVIVACVPFSLAASCGNEDGGNDDGNERQEQQEDGGDDEGGDDEGGDDEGGDDD